MKKITLEMASPYIFIGLSIFLIISNFIPPNKPIIGVLIFLSIFALGTLIGLIFPKFKRPTNVISIILFLTLLALHIFFPMLPMFRS